VSPSDRADGGETLGTSFGAVEPFTAEERARLTPYFTNVDQPVFNSHVMPP